MTLILFLLLSLAAHLPNASASPINHLEGGIHRRNDPSDDEFATREAAEILSQLYGIRSQQIYASQPLLPPQGLLSSNAPPVAPPVAEPVASKWRVSHIRNLLESDEESIQYPHDRKRRRISIESEEIAGLKTTGLDLPNASSGGNDSNGVPLSKFKDREDESAIQMSESGDYS